MSNRIISIGLLTEGDLQRLGKDFTRCYPTVTDGAFDDLLAKLDCVPAVDRSKLRGRRSQE